MRISKLKGIIFTSVVCVFGLSNVAVAQGDSPFSLEVSSDFYTDYIFRGQNLFDGTSIQPAVDGSFSLGELGTLGLGVWAHLSAEGGQGSEGFTEVDYTISYGVDLDAVSLGAGLIWYQFPRSKDAIDDTREFYLSAAVDTIGSPSLTYYRDYDVFKINYFDLSFSHDLTCDTLGDGVAITPSVTFGFATSADKVYADNSGLMHITVGVSTNHQLGALSLSPSFNYNFEMDDTAQNEFFFGVTVGQSVI